MSSSDASGLPSWAASFAATFERVARHLELGDGFMLLPVELPDAITAKLLIAWLHGRDLACHYVDLDPAAEPPPLLERLLAAPDETIATLLFIDTLTSWLPGALQLLNQQRDVLAHRHPRPLLWCGPARFLDLTWRSAPDLWSIAAVPIRLPAPTTRSFTLPAEKSHPVNRLSALEKLLISMYSGDELRRFVHMTYPEVVRELPGPIASAATLVHEAVSTLERQGYIDREFFERLRAERPRRYADIDAVARLWPEAAPLAPAGMNDADARRVLRSAVDSATPVLFVLAADVHRLHHVVQDTMDGLRSTHRVRTRPLLAMHDEESGWSDSPHRRVTSKASQTRRSPEITVVVDLEGRPLGEPDPAQLAEIRHLIGDARDALAHDRSSQLVIPFAGARATVRTTLLNLNEALSQARVPFAVVDLDAPPP